MNMGILPTNSLYQKVYQLCLNGKDVFSLLSQMEMSMKSWVMLPTIENQNNTDLLKF